MDDDNTLTESCDGAIEFMVCRIIVKSLQCVKVLVAVVVKDVFLGVALAVRRTGISYSGILSSIAP
jgi:hypothetical protein